MTHRIGIDVRKVRDFGIGTYLRNLVRAIAAIDTENEYRLFVGERGAEAFGPLPENFSFVEERAGVYSVREQFSLSWRLWREDLDLYHATHYVLPVVVTSRVVVTIHDIIHLLYPEYLPSRLAFLYAQRMIRRSLTRADVVIAVSRNTRDDLRQYFDVAPERVEVVYNGVEDVFHRQLDRQDLERWLDRLDLERPYLLFVGNPKPHKNLDNVMKAYARARELESFEAPLVCVGSRPEADFKLRQRAGRLGISEDVKLLGHVAQEALPAIYQGATLFLYPTLYEGFGLPVVEAMASGVPVITSDGSALKEIAQGYAHLVNPLDVEKMAQSIAHLLRDEEHRLSLAERGRKRARDFSWERAARHTLEIYERVLED